MPQQPVPISNDQMFKRVFGRNKELCRRLIELSLSTPIASVDYVESEHESRELQQPGGTYFDVLATTTSGEFIDVEMQAENKPGILQRARLYSGRLTNEAWSRYTANHDTYDYRRLPKVAVIFICNFDPLGDGARRYTGKMHYEGASSVANDGAVTVLLNAVGTGGDIEPELAAFLEYVASGHLMPGGSPFVDRVAREVTTANHEAGFRGGLMNLDEKLWWSRQEGAEERQKQIAELTSRMVADGRQDELPVVLTNPKLLDAELRRYDIEE